jgi:hypothetical protein
MVFGEPAGDIPGSEAGTASLILLGCLVALLLILGVWLPQPLRQCIEHAAAILRS